MKFIYGCLPKKQEKCMLDIKNWVDLENCMIYMVDNIKQYRQLTILKNTNVCKL